MVKIFRWVYLPFLVLMSLVVGGACYQTVILNPFWKNNISMFKNYSWGIDYFPILSPLMTVLWLVILVTGFKVKLPNQRLLYVGHFFFLVIMVSTFAFFAPFLLTYMGHPENTISDQELTVMLQSWSRWDRIRQVIGLIPLSIFIYFYSKIELEIAEK